ncbi:MAG: cobalamin biosynthesis protein CobD [Candidatus Brocadia sp. WS118]|nr:MAG: cobalamin biosynthesis protein CobD [Candidatus Brocadia sp. WS118]
MINPLHVGLIQLAVAYLADLAIGDPQWSYHPVRLIGRFIEYTELVLRKFALPERMSGIVLTTIVVLGTYLAIFAVMSVAKQCRFPCEIIIGAVCIYFTISIKSLADEARKIVISLKANDLIKARTILSHIVGRDTAHLTEEQIVRACVETVAEGSVDGIVSPLFYSFLGGPPGAMAYRAVNTLDSMVGYKNEKYMLFGWASARFDDVANYIPARICAVLVPAASFLCGCGFIRSLRIAFRDGCKHESPNSGIPEAAIAGALGVQLGGPSTYQGEVVDKPFIGDAQDHLTVTSIDTAVTIMYVTSVLFLICGIGVVLCLKYLIF